MNSLLSELISALKCLPGVGEKSAQRMALHLLEKNRKGGHQLAQTLELALQKIKHCSVCRNFTEQEVCELCAHPKRDKSKLCIVETPSDLLSIESAGGYRGLYFVLMGRLSPLDGVGPDDLGLPLLIQRLDREPVSELIFALGSGLESEVTVQYINEQLSMDKYQVSRIAYGVPMGGSLEYVDPGTLQHAFANRNKVN